MYTTRVSYSGGCVININLSIPRTEHAGVVRPKSYSEEKPYQDPNYQGYINNPVSIGIEKRY